MQRCLVRYFALTLTLVVLSDAISPAQAADQSSAPSCLAKAKTELAGKAPDAERDALACLIDTVAALDERERKFEQGRQSAGVLTLPQHADRNQRVQ